MIKPRLLVVELWGLGDLIIATPFLRAATERFEVTLLAKPHAAQLRSHLWPGVQVLPFQAPWTAFHRKYQLWHWPWRVITQVRRHLADEAFAVAVSCRPDPRDHLLMWSIGASERIGFARMRSEMFLTRPLPRPNPLAHRYAYWRAAAVQLGLALADEPFPLRSQDVCRRIFLHTGAGQPIRSWPLPRYLGLCQRLRAAGYQVQVACDPHQAAWWKAAGESRVAVPESVDTLKALLLAADCFVGNDSGPGHLAAALGLPTFSIFGPQLPEWFAPLSARGHSVEGKACPYRPCSDYCRFPVAHCLDRITEAEVWEQLQTFLNTCKAPGGDQSSFVL